MIFHARPRPNLSWGEGRGCHSCALVLHRASRSFAARVVMRCVRPALRRAGIEVWLRCCCQWPVVPLASISVDAPIRVSGCTPSSSLTRRASRQDRRMLTPAKCYADSSVDASPALALAGATTVSPSHGGRHQQAAPTRCVPQPRDVCYQGRSCAAHSLPPFGVAMFWSVLYLFVWSWIKGVPGIQQGAPPPYFDLNIFLCPCSFILLLPLAVVPPVWACPFL